MPYRSPEFALQLKIKNIILWVRVIPKSIFNCGVRSLVDPISLDKNAHIYIYLYLFGVCSGDILVCLLLDVCEKGNHSLFTFFVLVLGS